MNHLIWLLAQPAVTAPITGPRTIEQLEGSLRAPEAYAWSVLLVSNAVLEVLGL